MKKTKLFYRFIAVFLVIIMSFLAIPIQAIAQNIENFVYQLIEGNTAIPPNSCIGTDLTDLNDIISI